MHILNSHQLLIVSRCTKILVPDVENHHNTVNNNEGICRKYAKKGYYQPISVSFQMSQHNWAN